MSAKNWNDDTARHLLRVGWAAQPAKIGRQIKDWLTASLERLFLAKANPFHKPRQLIGIENDTNAFTKKLRTA